MEYGYTYAGFVVVSDGEYWKVRFFVFNLFKNPVKEINKKRKGPELLIDTTGSPQCVNIYLEYL